MYFTPCGWFSSGRYEVSINTKQYSRQGRQACDRVASGCHSRALPCSCTIVPAMSQQYMTLASRCVSARFQVLAAGCLKVSGHISTKEGKKVYALGGKWNEYLDAQRCDDDGNPLPDAEKLHLWKVCFVGACRRHDAVMRGCSCGCAWSTFSFPVSIGHNRTSDLQPAMVLLRCRRPRSRRATSTASLTLHTS